MAGGGRRTGAGRKPKDLDEHIAEGTYRRGRHGPTERAIRKGDGRRPPLPAGFNSREKTAWKTLLDGLEAEGLLDHADAPLYEAFAVQWARLREARADVHKRGLVVENERGQVVANPAVRIERDAIDRVRQLADQLAIGIQTRASLNLAVARGERSRGERPAKDAKRDEPADRIGLSPRAQLQALEGGKR